MRRGRLEVTSDDAQWGATRIGIRAENEEREM